MKLQSYLDRIRFTGEPHADFDTLKSIHAAHLRAIAYENLDIHLGAEISLGLPQIAEKIIHRGRGGWCFEMNRFLAWALEQIGFRVTLLGAAVGRQEGDDSTHLGHIVLRVDLEQPWLVDVGSGNGFLYPLPLTEGWYHQDFMLHQLGIEGGYWCYRNVTTSFRFDFTEESHIIDDFAMQCHRLQTSPRSGFVQVAVCKRFLEDRHVSLRGLVLTEISAQGTTERDINSHEEYRRLLTDTFDLHLSHREIDHLWTTVQPKHRQWVAAGRP